jgi:Flp pilus assembly pilin Flp
MEEVDMIDRIERVILPIGLEAGERIRHLRRSERGQAFVEYTLLLLLVAVAVVAVADWGGFTKAIGTALTTIANTISKA